MNIQMLYLKKKNKNIGNTTIIILLIIASVRLLHAATVHHKEKTINNHIFTACVKHQIRLIGIYTMCPTI